MKEEQQKYNVNFKTTSKPEEDKKVDAAKHKNFNKVYKQYSHWAYRNPWHRFQFHKSKNRKTTLYIMLIFLISALLIMEYLSEGTP